ncbi:MAG: tetratricopeptide repeat protein [Bacteroidetes bacterium]|nr:tetratricopeptide repeat protein [Bacteroidota bacterium]
MTFRRLILVAAAAVALPAAAQPFDASTPPTVWRDASRAFAERRYDDVRRLLPEATWRSPLAEADALLLDGRSLLATGQTAAAARVLDTFARRFPAHPLATDARLGVGQAQLAAGDLSAARATFEAVAASAPPNASAQASLWAAEVAVRQDDIPAALRFYDQAAARADDPVLGASALHGRAFQQLRLGQYDAAAATLEALERRYPQTPYAQGLGLAFAEAYTALGQYDRLATTVAPRLSDLQGEAHARAQLRLADAYLRLDQTADAAANFEAVAEDTSGSALPYRRPALFGLGHAHLNSGRFSEAVDAFARVREGQPDSLGIQAAFAEAVAYARARQDARADEAFARVVENAPASALALDARYERAVLLYRRGRFADAATAFEGFLNAAPPDDRRAAEALDLAANARVQAGDAAAAERLFDRAARATQDPSQRDAIGLRRAQLLFDARAYDRAFAAYRRLADDATTPDTKEAATFWAAESAFQQGQTADALAWAARSLERYPRGRFADAAAYVRAWSLFRAERYADAATAFERFLDGLGTGASSARYRDEAHLRLGDTYMALRRYDEAANAYSRATGEGRDYGLYGMGQAFFLGRNYPRAQRAWESLLREMPRSPWREEARYSLGYLHFVQGRYDDAIAEYRRLIAEAPNDPLAAKAQYGIADAYYNSDRPREAAEAYTVVLERFPASPFAADAAGNVITAYEDLGEGERGRALVARFQRSARPEVAEELRFRQIERAFARDERAAVRQQLEAFLQDARTPALRSEATYLLGDLLVAQGESEQGVRLLESVMRDEASPKRLEATGRLGDLYLAGNDAARALAAFQTLERLAPEGHAAAVESKLGQAEALLGLQRAAEAVPMLEPLYRDGNAEAALLLGMAYEAERRPADATTAYRAAARGDDAIGAEASILLGRLLLAHNDARGALQAAANAETRFDGFTDLVAQALLVRARAQTALNQKAAARTTYQRIEADHPGTEWATAAARERAALGN